MTGIIQEDNYEDVQQWQELMGTDLLLKVRISIFCSLFSSQYIL